MSHREATAPLVDERLAGETTPYVDALEAYVSAGPGRYNVPTHKGGPGAPRRLVDAVGLRALELDIPPLIIGIDGDADSSPYARAQQLAARAWGARRTWFLVNGASHGNQAACLALAHRGREVVVQRNVHSSVIDGLVLSGLRPIFVAPELDERLGIAHCVTPAALRAALALATDPAGVIVVSPSYYGTTADLGGLVEAAHERGVAIHVDEAWGAHFAFHESLPRDALSAGADLVVSSTHKMLGSLTQSAMIHLGDTDRIDEQQLDQAVTTLESTSRSALLALSLDAARHRAVTVGHGLIEASLPALRSVRERIAALPGLDVLDDRVVGSMGIAAVDPFRVCVDVTGGGADGLMLGRLLRTAHDVHVELTGANVMVAIFAMGERFRDGDRLVSALSGALASAAESTDSSLPLHIDARAPDWGGLAMTPRDAFFSPSCAVEIEAAVGRVSVESLAVYPPGIPNVLPGELLGAELIDFLVSSRARGAFIRGASDPTLETVRVLA